MTPPRPDVARLAAQLDIARHPFVAHFHNGQIVSDCNDCGYSWTAKARLQDNLLENLAALLTYLLAVEARCDALMEQGESIARERDVIQTRAAALTLADALAEAVQDLIEEITRMHAVEMAPDGPENCAAVCLAVAFVRRPLDAYRAAGETS